MFEQLKTMMDPGAEGSAFMTHPSVRIKGTELEWTAEICRSQDCQGIVSKGQHMHCPFCPVKSIFTDPFLLRAHYRVKHVDKGVDFAGLRILRCSNDCFIQGVIKEEKKFKGAHWHCFRCKNAFNRKDEALKHFKTHFKNPATTFQIQIAQDINQPNILDMYNKQSGPMSFRMYAKLNTRANLQQRLQSFQETVIDVESAVTDEDKEEYIISEAHEGTVVDNGEIVLITSEKPDGMRKTEEIIEALQKQVNTLVEEKEDMERHFQNKIEILNEEKKLLRQQLDSLQQGILSKMPASVLLESQFIARSLEQQFKDFVQFNMSKLSQCFLGMASSELSMNHVENSQEGLYNVTIQSRNEPGQDFVNSDNVTSHELVQNVITTEDYVHIDGVTSQVIGNSSCVVSQDVSHLDSNGSISEDFQQSGVMTTQELIQNGLTSHNLQQNVTSQEFGQDSIEDHQEEHIDVGMHQDPTATLVLNVETTGQDVPDKESIMDGTAGNPPENIANNSIQYITASAEEILDISVVQNSSNVPSAQFQVSIRETSNDQPHEQSITQKRTYQGRSTPPVTRKRGKTN
ncbi:uncharacterized protein LOC117118368 [Anneissia japonica]|uniref:uncharacterized protein LOC117118368 n=1 Tax=Anneissia japonica TaxID=1529436 RepID=UPI0014255481|nr:uncharacterized protein LOC117118368 [Anneissia japonica]